MVNNFNGMPMMTNPNPMLMNNPNMMMGNMNVKKMKLILGFIMTNI